MNDIQIRKLSSARFNAHELADEISSILALHWNGVEAGHAFKSAEERAIDNLHDIATAMGFRLVPVEAPVATVAAE